MKNLTEQLKKLAKELTQANHDGDEHLAQELQDKIWDIEDQLEDLAKDEYDSHHNDFR